MIDRTNGRSDLVVLKNTSSYSNCVVSAQGYATVLGAIQANPAQGPALVRAVVQRAVDSPAARYRNASRQWQREGCALIAALHNSSTATQRQSVAENLRNYTGDFTLLAAQD